MAFLHFKCRKLWLGSTGRGDQANWEGGIITQCQRNKILSENKHEIGRINLRFRTRDLGEDTLDRQMNDKKHRGTENQIRLRSNPLFQTPSRSQ